MTGDDGRLSSLGSAGEPVAPRGKGVDSATVQGLAACRAIVDGDGDALAAALQVILRDQLRAAPGIGTMDNRADCCRVPATALVALALERG